MLSLAYLIQVEIAAMQKMHSAFGVRHIGLQYMVRK